MADQTKALPAWGVLAEFPDITAVYHAAQRVRDAGYTRWDVHCPFPIHNMDEAMGLKPSRVAFPVGVGAFTGLVSALVLQGWTSGGFSITPEWLSGYRIVTAGKPFLAWEQFLPVTFELSVLFSAFGALLGMLAINGLPRWYHPLLKKERFLSSSDDGFFISIETRDPSFDPTATRDLLTDAGAIHVEEVEA